MKLCYCDPFSSSLMTASQSPFAGFFSFTHYIDVFICIPLPSIFVPKIQSLSPLLHHYLLWWFHSLTKLSLMHLHRWFPELNLPPLFFKSLDCKLLASYLSWHITPHIPSIHSQTYFLQMLLTFLSINDITIIQVHDKKFSRLSSLLTLRFNDLHYLLWFYIQKISLTSGST